MRSFRSSTEYKVCAVETFAHVEMLHVTLFKVYMLHPSVLLADEMDG